ncbi:MAG: hypothetical protein LAO09_13320 [Acidobacteriia bacterium]|nr:hypothetical protein [Terriglobia bacterium]
MDAEERSSAYEQHRRRLDLMRELAHSLALAQAAVVRSDLRDMQCQTAQQQRLCEQLSQLGQLASPTEFSAARRAPAALAGWTRCEGAASALAGERWGALLEELTQVELQVAGLNRAYGALLRRASRTVEIFCRVLATSGVTYGPPQSRQNPSAGLRK